MDIVLVAISIASLISNVVLVRHFTKNRVFLPATTEYLQPPLEIEVEQDVVEKEEIPPPSAVAVPDSSPWVNRSGIGVNSGVPAPPIQPIQRPPLARPDGFVR